ncbi:T9SS type A sorting domain-containing protein [Pontibacter locisalis]|uniref:T9SS type A sorting domain-containing protein n=1 Tax=Pontibacter locisalis TaxID=1719035 RepID=A0ABW5IPZ0_9BACT
MKIKQKYTKAIACTLSLAALSLTATAQIQSLPKQELKHILVIAEEDTTGDTTRETLSGINLLPAGKGTFQLDFSQNLEENATLQITDASGKLVFQKPVSIANNKKAWRYNVGKLQPSVYLVEVKTSDTTYWTKFKVGR